MAALNLTISPFPVPETVEVLLPSGEAVKIPISDLDEETLGELIEAFSTALIKLTEK